MPPSPNALFSKPLYVCTQAKAPPSPFPLLTRGADDAVRPRAVAEALKLGGEPRDDGRAVLAAVEQRLDLLRADRFLARVDVLCCVALVDSVVVLVVVVVAALRGAVAGVWVPLGAGRPRRSCVGRCAAHPRPPAPFSPQSPPSSSSPSSSTACARSPRAPTAPAGGPPPRAPAGGRRGARAPSRGRRGRGAGRRARRRRRGSRRRAARSPVMFGFVRICFAPIGLLVAVLVC